LLAAGLDEAGLVSDHHQLGAVAGAKLNHRAVGVGLGRGLGDEQPLGDLLVGQSGGFWGVGIGDTVPELYQETYVTAAACFAATERVHRPGRDRRPQGPGRWGDVAYSSYWVGWVV
jgi:hypothetical protein